MLVCCHDAACAGLGPVADVVHGALGPDDRARLFTFEQFLDVLGSPATRPTAVHLDVKEPGYEQAAVDALARRGRAYLVTTPHETTIAAWRRLAPEVHCLLTVGGSTRRLELGRRLAQRQRELWPFEQLRRCGADGVAVHHLLATPALRRWCDRRDLTVLVWTVDHPAALRRWLRHRRVDIVTTNRPILAERIRDAKRRAG